MHRALWVRLSLLCVVAIVSAVTAIAVIGFSGVTVSAAELELIEVSNQRKRFFVKSKATLDAPIDDVYFVLLDFDNYEKFSSIYHDARWLERNADDSGEIYTYTRGCIAFFCKGFGRTEAVEVDALKTIVTTVDAERSDVRYGSSTWVLEDLDGRTVINFDMAFEPDFWIPPLIGPYMVKRMLRKGGRDALLRIETLAQQKGRIDDAASVDANDLTD